MTSTVLNWNSRSLPFQSEEFEFQEFERGPSEELMSENEEIQLAHELLAVNNEQELEQFLGDFIKKAVSTVGQAAKSPIGQAIGGALKGVARKALPMAGQALGGYIGGPLGAKIGTGLANAAGKAIGLEFEFGESEELEFTAPASSYASPPTPPSRPPAPPLPAPIRAPLHSRPPSRPLASMRPGCLARELGTALTAQRPACRRMAGRVQRPAAGSGRATGSSLYGV